MSLASTQSTRVIPSRSSAGGFVSHRTLLILVSELLILGATYYCAFSLRFDFSLHGPERIFFWKTVGIALAFKIFFFYTFGLLRGWWRYVGMSDLLDISKATLASTVCLALIVQL